MLNYNNNNKKNGKIKTKQVMYNTGACYLLTDARLPFPKPDWLQFWIIAFSLYTGHDIL